MSKTITIFLGGKERTLDVGKWWFTKFFGQASGSDPLNSTDILLKPENQFDFVVNMVYAGMRTHYKVSKIAEDFTKDEVEDWLGCLEGAEIEKLIVDYSNLSVKGEAVAPESGA
jgi:hypothetical protein